MKSEEVTRTARTLIAQMVENGHLIVIGTKQYALGTEPAEAGMLRDFWLYLQKNRKLPVYDKA